MLPKPNRTYAALVVEDEPLIAIMFEDMLNQIGFGSVSIAYTQMEGLDLASTRHFDFALLDFDLGSDNSLPVADRLKASRVPFAICTGYGPAETELFGPDVPLLPKLFEMQQLAGVIEKALLPPPFGTQN
ncbi:MAG: Response regulator receiver protein [Devosia sp.]|uniref:response regulator n=1 Tax=Devosia sp. TaxID=1871048 RepID=UPI002616DBBA|nr:response regulator [Devosia sp.]MDB5529136.1 Response regulator receiver protein [Devosia sp.]